MRQFLVFMFFIGTFSALAQKHIVIEDLSYVSDTLNKHKLDLYLPENISEAPVLLWIHGGAWAFGSRKKEKALATRFAEKGIVVAAMSYRLSPALWADPKFDKGVQHPAHIRDVASAFAWLYQQAGQYGFSKDNIFISGYSAGGHLSALLATDETYLAEHNLSLSHIKGTIPIAGAYDIHGYYQTHYKYNGQQMADQHVKGVFGDSDKDLIDASPTRYVQYLQSPMLLISESQSYKYTKLFEDTLKSSGMKNVTYLHVKDLDHKGFYQHLAEAPESGYRQSIVDFIWNHYESNN